MDLLKTGAFESSTFVVADAELLVFNGFSAADL